MWEYNRGEWTEAYVFLRLLEKGRLYGADSSFQRDENTYIDIQNIIRYEKKHLLKYERLMAKGVVAAFDDQSLCNEIDYRILGKKADYLLEYIKSVKKSKRKFSVPEIESYLVNLNFSQPKAPSMPKSVSRKYGKKTDIILTVENSIDHAKLTTGFSIKSHLGSRPTLFNSAPASNLRFEITGCTDNDMNILNGKLINKPKEMIKYIRDESRLNLIYVDTSDEFADNLDLIDERMEKVFAALLLIQIGYYPVTNESIHFKHKPIEGSEANPNLEPDELILDGQQRLTSLYNALYSKNPVHTKTDKGQEIDRYYYLDIEKAVDSSADDDEVVISIPQTKRVTSDFGRKVDLDLSSRQLEFEKKMFPLNIILDSGEEQGWQNEYYAYYNYDPVVIQKFTELFSKIIMPTQKYAMPVILLDKETPKEAVCQVFENVNTGGVSLTVFELVTAIFAMDDFPLRNDWDERKEKYFSGELLNIVTATDFLTALTLLSSFMAGGTVSCKKKDVLALQLTAYKKYADDLCKGFSVADKLLQEERIFSSRDLPYTTQLIPLAAICTALMDGNMIYTTTTKNMVKQWYWCGVFGELYGSANETRYANDISQVIRWIKDNGDLPKTVTDFFFNPTRLLGLRTRQSAAYKGIMALILKNHARDFISGAEMDFSTYSNEKIDIHHIFPKNYCIGQNFDIAKWNSIVNKTPISASSNREIGGVAPSVYLGKLEKKGSVLPSDLDGYVETHWIDHTLLRNNEFQEFIIDRAKKLLNSIEMATGRTISGKDSEEVIQAFGDSLN